MANGLELLRSEARMLECYIDRDAQLKQQYVLLKPTDKILFKILLVDTFRYRLFKLTKSLSILLHLLLGECNG